MTYTYIRLSTDRSRLYLSVTSRPKNKGNNADTYDSNACIITKYIKELQSNPDSFPKTVVFLPKASNAV